MRVIIIGAGLGGLACAIACRREGLEALVLEKAPEILPIGAGIQIPPNGAKVCRSLGILPHLTSKGTTLDGIDIRRYATGDLLHERGLGEATIRRYGAPWIVIHRSDYHQVLLDAATAAGAEIRLGAEVEDLDFASTSVWLSDGTTIQGDVIIGADGLWSLSRDKLLGRASPPVETGDLAYRGTFTKQQLLDLHDARVEELCSRKIATVWFGPDKHAVFYPVRGGREFNLVLLRPDNLPNTSRTEQGSIEEMRATFEGWDEILTKIISCVPTALKWKLCHHEELESWTRGNVALLGDACHPTLPYQAQGAAMAVEDGAVLGKLLGLAARSETTTVHIHIADVLMLYETLRKTRTTANVKGALNNRKMYHLPDGEEQRLRDAALRDADWNSSTSWKWMDPEYNMDMLGFDAVQDCERALHDWVEAKHSSRAIQWEGGDGSRKGGSALEKL